MEISPTYSWGKLTWCSPHPVGKGPSTSSYLLSPIRAPEQSLWGVAWTRGSCPRASHRTWSNWMAMVQEDCCTMLHSTDCHVVSAHSLQQWEHNYRLTDF